MNQQDITNKISEVQINADENGLISSFGVQLTKIHGDYYLMISEEFERMFAGETSDPTIREAAHQLLIEAGHVCGFNTFGGVMESEVWEALVLPEIEKKEDWITGMIAIINVFGWGVYHIEELNPEKLVLKIENSYEGDAYNRLYGGNATTPKCFLAVGASISLMSLVFHADISKKPELDDVLYEELFLHKKKFKGRETSCIAMGDPYCTVEITLNS